MREGSLDVVKKLLIEYLESRQGEELDSWVIAECLHTYRSVVKVILLSL